MTTSTHLGKLWIIPITSFAILAIVYFIGFIVYYCLGDRVLIYFWLSMTVAFAALVVGDIMSYRSEKQCHTSPENAPA